MTVADQVPVQPPRGPRRTRGRSAPAATPRSSTASSSAACGSARRAATTSGCRSGERIDLLLDPGTFEERDAGLTAVDPPRLPRRSSLPGPARGVADQDRAARRGRVGDRRDRRTNASRSAIFDFRFMGGSMGSVVGEKLARCFETALAERIPAIVVSASGGARMQEGTLSLMQLAKTTAPLVRLDAAGVPFITVLTDPTTGGVLASFASVGRRDPGRAEGAHRLRGRPRGLRHRRRGDAGGIPDRGVPARARLRRRGRAAPGAAQPRLGRLLRLLPVPVAGDARRCRAIVPEARSARSPGSRSGSAAR